METEALPRGLIAARHHSAWCATRPTRWRRNGATAGLLFLRKFQAPVPRMLEATIALQLALGKGEEAAIIAILLISNALLVFSGGFGQKALAR